MDGPERFVVGHPFNPVYLLPLVEVCAAERTAAETVARAAAIYRVGGHAATDRPPRGRRLHRRPPARGAVARGAVAGRRRRRHRRGDRRRHPLRRRAALGGDGHLPHLPPGRRRSRHAPFHGPVRPGAAAALDPSHRRAGAQRRAAGHDRGPVRRPGRRALDRRARAHPRRLPGRRAAGPEGRRLRRRRGGGADRARAVRARRARPARSRRCPTGGCGCTRCSSSPRGSTTTAT